ncbi:MAG: formate dehydrogenase accessory sulfurtransferase FdhD [Candidatus Cloacimonetes bacterium]|nr:formate dehydrogenase accessory sulfurtransferase FdhD [Candidatus Cloacimonadota bacterium]
MEKLIIHEPVRIFQNDRFIDIEKSICIERNIDIFINEIYYMSLMCLPEKLDDLIVGFLFNNDIIEKYSDIKKIKILKERINVLLNKPFKIDADKKFTLTSGCGNAMTSFDLKNLASDRKNNLQIKLHSEQIIELMNQFNKKSDLFLETGCVHSCALAEEDKILFSIDDIGRHNSLDKIVGNAMINNIDLSSKILLTTGRLSFEMIAKVIKCNIPIIISRSAPTCYAVKLAAKYNVTMIGFARGKKFNVYTGFERIK